jgi:hypothetical protein
MSSAPAMARTNVTGSFIPRLVESDGTIATGRSQIENTSGKIIVFA